jgi:hypothetical protein
MLGARPISLIGAELEYLDFGHTSLTPIGGYQTYLQEDAQAAFGVLYAPIPVPVFDLYGKVGVSSLHSTLNDLAVGPFCPPLASCPAVAHENYYHEKTGTCLAYGVGLQVKLARFAIRAEYERISASFGDPSLMSLGLIWRFY